MVHAKSCVGPLALETLAQGYCKSIENAKRLVDDAETLMKAGRHMGAINSLRLAIEEMAKAHLINQAVLFSDHDSDKWEWFWGTFWRHREKLRLLEYELHWGKYKNKEEFNNRINLLISTREDSTYVKFDYTSRAFLTPEEIFRRAGDIIKTVKIEFRYALKLFELFTPVGMPSVETMLKVFRLQRNEKAWKNAQGKK